LKLAKKAQQKKRKPESKINRTQDEVTENGVEDESEEGSEEESEEESDANNLAEDFEEDDDSDSEVVPDIEMTSKDQAARTLEVRRAIEERMEQRKFKDDLDYLDDDI
tara:strand:- start:123 stop:446 length:324 start_codon:yes stop_codon:yes gene_type:complete